MFVVAFQFAEFTTWHPVALCGSQARAQLIAGMWTDRFEEQREHALVSVFEVPA